MKIGSGYDVHRLVEGRRLVIGGVTIDWRRGLAGHSDGDVLLHAVSDACLGAAGLGDIGRHFPPTVEYKNADSRWLLRRVRALLADAKLTVVNVDATVIAEQPRLAPHINAMRDNIAADLGVAAADVNVKATTTDGLGVIGRGQGIAAMAVALLANAGDGDGGVIQV